MGCGPKAYRHKKARSLYHRAYFKTTSASVATSLFPSAVCDSARARSLREVFIIKSLTYFDDAEADSMPTLFFKTTWTEIKAYFRREVPRLARELLHLD
ncbi:hypothetical protein HY627_02160 [Candidatus Uhrbacteria bacterium]|nr:hypothetical protein [Candidatus Uhrbacteria bacterium]